MSHSTTTATANATATVTVTTTNNVGFNFHPDFNQMETVFRNEMQKYMSHNKIITLPSDLEHFSIFKTRRKSEK